MLVGLLAFCTIVVACVLIVITAKAVVVVLDETHFTGPRVIALVWLLSLLLVLCLVCGAMLT